MKNQKRKLLDLETEENLQIIISSRPEKRSSRSVREFSVNVHVPLDLLIEIFSRVPAKSIARFRCLSKFWASIFVSPEFTELFLSKSLNRPRILFDTIQLNKEEFLFSSPQPQDPDPDENCCLVITRHKKLPKQVPLHGKYDSSQLGLVLLYTLKEGSLMIYNLTTGESITLPKPEVNSIGIGTNFLCYDPTNKQFKVLCTRWRRRDGTRSTSHRVLTLETGNLCWRTIKCKCKPSDYFIKGEVCINGVLYYGAYNKGTTSLVVCFDVRYEEFSYININVQDMFQGNKLWSLANYKGKLCLHVDDVYCKDTELVLWVLEDALNNK